MHLSCTRDRILGAVIAPLCDEAVYTLFFIQSANAQLIASHTHAFFHTIVPSSS